MLFHAVCERHILVNRGGIIRRGNCSLISSGHKIFMGSCAGIDGMQHRHLARPRIQAFRSNVTKVPLASVFAHTYEQLLL